MGEWSVLIPSNASYKMNDGGHTWEGYRYFKNPQHYKYFKYNFTQYSNLLDRII
jgi:YHS domain-containing protein